MTGLLIFAGVLILVLVVGVTLTARWFRSERRADERRYADGPEGANQASHTDPS